MKLVRQRWPCSSFERSSYCCRCTSKSWWHHSTSKFTFSCLQRRLPGIGIEIKYKQTELNLLDLVLKGSQSQNPFLFDGDTIHIKRAIETPEEASELAAVNLSQRLSALMSLERWKLQVV